MALRFAYQHLAKPVMNLFRGQSAGDLALRFGPDVGYALMAGGMFAPENATMGERAAMMGEDLAYGVGSSILGQLGGRRIGMGRAKANMQKAKAGGFANPQAKADAALAARNTVNAYTTGGDVLGQMGMVMLPRPVTQGVYEAAAERGDNDSLAVNETQRGMLEEQQLMTILGQLAEAGYLGGQQMGMPQPQVSARALNA